MSICTLMGLMLLLVVSIALQWSSIVVVVVGLLVIQTLSVGYTCAAALEWRLVAITNSRGKTLVLRAPAMKRKNLTTGLLRFVFAAAPLLSAGILQYAFVGIYEELKTQPYITESAASSIQWLPNSLVFLVSFLLVLLAFVYWLVSCAFRIRLNDGKLHLKIISNQFRQLQLLKGTDGESLLEGYFASVIFCVAGSLSTTWLLNLTSFEKQPLTPAQWGLWFTMLPIFLVVRQLWRILPDVVLENFRGFVCTLLVLVAIWVVTLVSLVFFADSLNSAFVAYLAIFMAPELLPAQEQVHKYVRLVGCAVLVYYALLSRRLVVDAWKKFFTVEPLVTSPTA